MGNFLDSSSSSGIGAIIYMTLNKHICEPIH